MVVTFNNNTSEFEKGTTCAKILKSFGDGVYDSALCVKINGKVSDVYTEVYEDCLLEVCTYESEDGMWAYRHSASHLLAQAVKRIYPTARIASGDATKDGFYYDFEFKTSIKSTDLKKIETEMKRIVNASIPLQREKLSISDAFNFFSEGDEFYKLELVSLIPKGEDVTICRQGDFVDICSGTHIINTGQIKAFTLTEVTGAYWQGKSKNRMLTRIHGVAFATEEELQTHLEQKKAKKAAKQNSLGKKLEYFATSADVGRGLPLLLPKGALVVNKMCRLVEDEEELLGFLPTCTPKFAKKDLFDKGENTRVFSVNANSKKDAYILRPSMMPMQYSVFKNGLKSYKDLPTRFFETGSIFRRANSGEICGLTIKEEYTVNHTSQFCRRADLMGETIKAVNITVKAIKCLGLMKYAELCLLQRGKVKGNYEGDPEEWIFAETCLKEALDLSNIKYHTRVVPAGSCGPKVEARVKCYDGRSYVVSDVQIDILLAEKTGLRFVDDDGEKKTPYVVLSMPVGYAECTLGVMIEKNQGNMPLWIAPEQVRVVSLTDRTSEIAKQFTSELISNKIRATADVRSIKVGSKLSKAFSDSIPYTVVIGDKEAADGTVSVTAPGKGRAITMGKAELIEQIKTKTENKNIN